MDLIIEKRLKAEEDNGGRNYIEDEDSNDLVLVLGKLKTKIDQANNTLFLILENLSKLEKKIDEIDYNAKTILTNTGTLEKKIDCDNDLKLSMVNLITLDMYISEIKKTGKKILNYKKRMRKIKEDDQRRENVSSYIIKSHIVVLGLVCCLFLYFALFI